MVTLGTYNNDCAYDLHQHIYKPRRVVSRTGAKHSQTPQLLVDRIQLGELRGAFGINKPPTQCCKAA